MTDMAFYRGQSSFSNTCILYYSIPYRNRSRFVSTHSEAYFLVRYYNPSQLKEHIPFL